MINSTTEIVSQERLLEEIKKNPGILQTELKKMAGVDDVSLKLKSLRVKKLIFREPCYEKQTWRIFPVK